MKNVIYEYAGTILSLVSSMGVLAVVGNLFLGETGLFKSLILMAVGGN